MGTCKTMEPHKTLHHQHQHGHHGNSMNAMNGLFNSPWSHNSHGNHGDQIPPEMRARIMEMQQNAVLFNWLMHLALFGLFICACVWAYFERQRRRRIAAEAGGFPARSGDYVSGLFECFGHPRICFPACLFTPFLAAFNRAAADNRDCTACDACFSLKTPFTQYHTRQSVRSMHHLEEANCLDCLTACCCTSCAVGQDALELSRRAAVAAAPAPAVSIVVPEGACVVDAVPSKETGYAPVQLQV